MDEMLPQAVDFLELGSRLGLRVCVFSRALLEAFEEFYVSLSMERYI